MKFNDTSNTHDSLVHGVNDILGIDNNQFSLAWKARVTNGAKTLLALKTWKNQTSWKFDDNGNSGLPEITATMTNNTEEVSIPTSSGVILEIDRVEVKDTAGNWRKLNLIAEGDIGIALPEFEETAGMPKYYLLNKRSIVLKPAPSSTDVTLTDGLKIYARREVNEFDSSTTTTEIGFENPGDRVIMYMVAEEYAGVRGLINFPQIQQKRIEAENEYLTHISHRTRDKKPRLIPYVENYE